MNNPLDARAKRSQQALLKAGLELLNENPEASLSDIAAHAGVGRATLYRQYETREKLVLAIALDCFDVIDEATAPIENQARSALDALRMTFERVMPLTREFQFLMNLERVIENEPAIAAINAKQRNELVELVKYGQTHHEIDKALPAEWVVNLVEAMFYAGWQQLQQAGQTPQQVARLAFTALCRGIEKP